MKKTLTDNPLLLVVYLLIAIVIIANIFVSGYWFGRGKQVLEGIRPNQAAAESVPTR